MIMKIRSFNNKRSGCLLCTLHMNHCPKSCKCTHTILKQCGLYFILNSDWSLNFITMFYFGLSLEKLSVFHGAMYF